MTVRNSHIPRRFFAPEVVQTSAMDCGPAALKCLLRGFGISASYGRLREACQTDVDGTSIDTLEEVAGQLGLEAEQIMIPADFLLLREADVLPAIVVALQPNGVTHFVVAWRRHGQFVQVMDPATGRRWPKVIRFLDEVYVHNYTVPVTTWLEWARSDSFLLPLGRRLSDLGLQEKAVAHLLREALADPGWRSLACLDAAARMVNAIVGSRGLSRGPQAASVLKRFYSQAVDARSDTEGLIPEIFWSVRFAPLTGGEEEKLTLRGAVLVRIRGRRIGSTAGTEEAAGQGERGAEHLSPELVAALNEPPSQPGRDLLRLLHADGVLSPLILTLALFLAAAGVLMEAVLFRGLFDIGRSLGLSGQRLAAMGALLTFVSALLLLEIPIVSGALRLGRKLELRLRLAFLEKIPRLTDRYFQSRLTSDMAERSHTIHQIRQLPTLGTQLLRNCFELVLTAVGIAWIDPRSAPLACLAALLAVALPLVVQPWLAERDLRLRSHTGALSRFYLDAFLGLVAIRAHGAERNVRREHESLLVAWARAGLGLQRAVVSVEGVQFFLGFGFAAWILLGRLARGGEVGMVLLLTYWALNLPVLAQEIALIAWQYPAQRNMTLRLLEPLGAPEEKSEWGRAVAPRLHVGGETDRACAVAIALESVTVRAAGHTILEGIGLRISPGQHVAIVGPSGAGKSSLVGLLLGWHRPASGQVLVDGQRLVGHFLERLRRETAWVDPSVQLWNRPLLENLHYGSTDASPMSLGRTIEGAELPGLLEKLPDGLQTLLGEGGALVSGGEGQRVRVARAMLRSPIRLVILDEPFTGLEREIRRRLLARVRKQWAEATLLCVTHDVSDTKAFDRVLVLERGRVIEDGEPTRLSEQLNSRYHALLEAEEALREGSWSSGRWRRLWLDNGQLADQRKPT